MDSERILVVRMVTSMSVILSTTTIRVGERGDTVKGCVFAPKTTSSILSYEDSISREAMGRSA